MKPPLMRGSFLPKVRSKDTSVASAGLDAVTSAVLSLYCDELVRAPLTSAVFEPASTSMESSVWMSPSELKAVSRTSGKVSRPKRYSRRPPAFTLDWPLEFQISYSAGLTDVS